MDRNNDMRKRYIWMSLLIGFGALLLLSDVLTGKTGLWFAIDETIFRFFNDRLVPGSAFFSVTAYTNLRVFDVVAFLSMGLLYFYYFRRQDAAGKRRMIALGVLMLLTAVFIKQCGRFIPISHPSPTLFFEDANRLTALTDIGTKDAARNSFPGDHGMMLMIFAAFMARYCGARAFAVAALLVVVFSMPRLMSGAHWFSDVYAGSLSFVCILCSVLLLTPASDRLADLLERLIPKRFFPDA